MVSVWTPQWAITFTTVNLWGARVMLWWEHSPPTSVAWVLSLAPRGFLWALRFSQTLSNLNPLLKNQDSTNTSKFQFNLEHTDMFKLVYKNSYVILEFKTYYNLQFTGSQLNWDFTRELSLHPWCLLSKSLW